jgi:membrane fusion protein
MGGYALTAHFFRQAVSAETEKTTASMPAAPIAWSVFGGFLIAATAALVIFISTAGYARKETASGSLISTAGVVRVSARSGGVVTDLAIGEGDRVEMGQALFTIDSQQGLESGGTLVSALMTSLDVQIRLLNQQIDSNPNG